jgi:hypothetical protein
MIVDKHEPKIFNFDESLKSSGSSDVHFNNVDSFYVGRNETTVNGFSGCVSRIEGPML